MFQLWMNFNCELLLIERKEIIIKSTPELQGTLCVQINNFYYLKLILLYFVYPNFSLNILFYSFPSHPHKL